MERKPNRRESETGWLRGIDIIHQPGRPLSCGGNSLPLDAHASRVFMPLFSRLTSAQPKISALALRDLVIEPGPGMGPVITGGPRRDVQQAGGFFGGQPDEIAQLDQFRLNAVLRGELIQGVIDR
jgi:hypothetical protein